MIGIPRKLAAKIQMCLNKADSKLGYANNNPQNFPFRMARNRKKYYHRWYPILLGNMPLGESKRNRKG
jgi:hypothetical protein